MAERNGTKTGFEEIDRTVDEFERLMKAHGLEIRGGTLLEHACLVLQTLHSRRERLVRDGIQDPWPTMGRDLRLALGAWNIVQLAVSLQAHPEFARVVPHLALLNEGVPAQTIKAPITDDAANKIFELRMALACLRTGKDLEMDDPVSSSGGANPDILCRLADGRMWGFSCKVVHGANPMTVADRYLEGIDQIERSRADVGLVVVSFKNVLPDNAFLPVLGADASGDPVLGAFRNPATPVLIAAEEVGKRATAMAHAATDTELHARLTGKKALTAVASAVDVVAMVRGIAAGPTISAISFLRIVHFNHLGLNNSFDGRAEAITRDINDGLAVREMA